jgi:hypothetical protein
VIHPRFAMIETWTRKMKVRALLVLVEALLVLAQLTLS